MESRIRNKKVSRTWDVGEIEVLLEAYEDGAWSVEVSIGPLDPYPPTPPTPWTPDYAGWAEELVLPGEGKIALRWALMVAEAVLQRLWKEQEANKHENHANTPQPRK